MRVQIPQGLHIGMVQQEALPTDPEEKDSNPFPDSMVPWPRGQAADCRSAYIRSNRIGTSIWSGSLMARHLPAKEAAQQCA